MNVLSIPSAFDSNTDDVVVIDYKSSQESKNLKFQLEKNVVSFLIEGEKKVIQGHSSIVVDNSQFVIMRSGHCLMSESLSERKGYRSILLVFSNEEVLSFARKYGFNATANPGSNSLVGLKYDPYLRHYQNSLIESFSLSPNERKQILKIKLEELLLYIVSTHGTSILSVLASTEDEQIQKLQHIVETNQLNRLTLNELAFLCNTSVSTFKRAFRKVYKQPPMKWFQERRLEYAFHLISKEHYRPSDVYLDAGYENLSSFIHAYKTKFGVTPRQHAKPL